MANLPTITLSKEGETITAVCTDPKLRNGCSFVITPGKRLPCNCVQAASRGVLSGQVELVETSPGLKDEALKKRFSARCI